MAGRMTDIFPESSLLAKRGNDKQICGMFSLLRNQTLFGNLVWRMFVVLCMGGCLTLHARAVELERIPREVLMDKIRGAWAGQMIGVAYGGPTEFKAAAQINEDVIQPPVLTNSIDEDDLYVEMTFARVMDTVGLDATSLDYAVAFRDSKYRLWHANAGARRNLSRGLLPPDSGNPRYNAHADDIDFQIEADFIGIMCPGMPRSSNRFCDKVGHVMNHGDGVYGGMFVCGMYCAAYFESDPQKIVEAGLACIPARSSYAALIRDLLDAFARRPGSWSEAWQIIEDKWNKDDACPEGALSPFNIDAKLNGAYIAMGLLYGGGDFDRTMDIATRCGQDSDCNPSSACGVIGAVLGFSRLPPHYQKETLEMADMKFSFTDYSFNDIVKSTEARTVKLIQREGGKVTGQDLFIRRQKPQAPKLEQCNFGVPTGLIHYTNSAWKWSSGWTNDDKVKAAYGAGSEAVLEFDGTGIALLGQLSQGGGRADVYIDGKRQGLRADAWIPERTSDKDLWRVYGLRNGHHTLRLMTLAEGDPRSKGARMAISRAVVYQAKPSAR